MGLLKLSLWNFIFALFPFFSNSLFGQASDVNNFFLQTLKENLEKNVQEQDWVFINTDREFYQPGETIWWSAFLVTSPNLFPSSTRRILHVQLLGKKNSKFEILQHKIVIANKGIASGEFALPSKLQSGAYLLRAYTLWQLNSQKPSFFEKIIIICPQEQFSKVYLNFDKPYYKPGDWLKAYISIKDSLLQPYVFTPFNCQLLKDTLTLLSRTYTTNSLGQQIVQVKIPDIAPSTNYGIKIICSKTPNNYFYFPIPLQSADIQLQFFPEGHRLVSGFENHVGFRATTAQGQPIEIEGMILDPTGTFIASIKTIQNGIGSFRFTPSALTNYRVRITKPQGIKQEFMLPRVQEKGTTWEVQTTSSNILKLRIFSSLSQNLGILISSQGKIFFQKSIIAQTGENNFAIPLETLPRGVARIFLVDSSGKFLASRYVLVNSNKKLN
ncbi:MAG: hypothetical protein RML72_04010, partial [Bacteroidia bacterium]|nr:hypothetical protein [Bacteroidia bacterium]MDW8158028.1 hypothetical protein [Bacteroidia bacterium]